MVGIGSTEPPESTPFEILEQLCQSGFSVYLVLELYCGKTESKFYTILDILCIACSFGGIHTRGQEVSRWLLAIRALKARYIFKEFPALEEEMVRMRESYKLAANILLPVLLLILTYAIVGLHLFGGNCHLI